MNNKTVPAKNILIHGNIKAIMGEVLTEHFSTIFVHTFWEIGGVLFWQGDIFSSKIGWFLNKNQVQVVSVNLTQCARIRVPLVVMKIEKFKDLFRAALDRWLDSHESKNFGFGRTRRHIRPIFSAILPILGKI